ncbi:hypothetical protein [Streptomyces solincola]|uniref:hypothetical protein n=1 Tax=Streptomyces solincola TaxID=2100817 RepID=UPI0011B259DA|nr:hypothetical protein [Streptomyces solincola]
MNLSRRTRRGVSAATLRRVVWGCFLAALVSTGGGASTGWLWPLVLAAFLLVVAGLLEMVYRP